MVILYSPVIRAYKASVIMICEYHCKKDYYFNNAQPHGMFKVCYQKLLCKRLLSRIEDCKDASDPTDAEWEHNLIDTYKIHY